MENIFRNIANKKKREIKKDKTMKFNIKKAGGVLDEWIHFTYKEIKEILKASDNQCAKLDTDNLKWTKAGGGV